MKTYKRNISILTIVIMLTIGISMPIWANNSSDKQFWHTFMKTEQYFTVNFGSGKNVTKEDTSPSYVKNTSDVGFYVESIREQDPSRTGAGAKRSNFKNMYLNPNQAMLGASSVPIGKRAVPRIGKKGWFTTPSITGLFSPDSYGGLTGTQYLN